MAASNDVWDRFIELGHDGTGPIIPTDCYGLYITLRDRGLTFTSEPGDHTPVLVVSPPEALTDEDCADIRRWKWHLLMLMEFDGRLDAHVLFTDTKKTHKGNGSEVSSLLSLGWTHDTASVVC